MNNWHVVGRIRDAHGIKGELFVALKAKTADWLESLEVLGLKTASGLEFQSHDVTAARPHKDGLIVRLQNVDDRNQADLLRGSTVAIPEEYLEGDTEDGLFLQQLEGAKIFDTKGVEVGTVVAFGFNGAQDLLVIENPKGRFDIPFVEDFIVELDLNEKHIVMELPEGLVEI